MKEIILSDIEIEEIYNFDYENLIKDITEISEILNNAHIENDFELFFD